MTTAAFARARAWLRALRLGQIVALLAVMVALLASLLVVAPAPGNLLALLAVLISEKTFLPVALALAGAACAWVFSGAPTRPRGAAGVRWLGLALALPTLLIGAWPVGQALRLARASGLTLDPGRYLTAAIDTDPGFPDGTVTFATVAGGPLRLDFYAPEGAGTDPAPAVVVVHGGGWAKGDKGETGRSNRWLARRGFAVFDIQYRLTPQPNWQTATGDVKCAVGWVKERAQGQIRLLIDPEKVALLGRSAGGHLALLAAYSAGDPALPPSCPVQDSGVAAVAAYYAPTDLVWGYERPANRRVYDTSQKLRDFLGGTPDSAPGAYQAASIVNRVTDKAPRTLLVHGGRDQFVSPLHIDRLMPFLQRSGIENQVLVIPYAQHGFDHIFGGLSGQLAEGILLRFLQQGQSRLAVAPSAD